MSTLFVSPCRDVTCAAGAALITLALSMTFVETTAITAMTRRPAHSASAPGTPVQLHGWVGQPKPAVLVD
jgi:hypothetical protein